MTMKINRLLSAIIAVMAMSAPIYAQTYLDTNATPYERAKSIVGEMTLEEKVSLMRHDSPAIPRLGIKAYNWWNEALHGVARAGLATVFPQPIGMAASFDDQLLFDVFTAASDEGRAKHQLAKENGKSGHYQGITYWTPNINIFRDPRWGRGHETYGEDPYLTGRMGTSVVRGLQGDNFEGTRYIGPDAPKYYKAQACAKHFAVHSGPEWNRHQYNAEVSDRDLYETYLPAFEALVKDAKVKEVMCAYNRLEGQPCCGNSVLLQSILRDKWGYKGLVVSDCWAVSDFYNGHNNDYDVKHAVSRAVGAGTDLECGTDYANLVDAVKKGLIDEEKINQSVMKIMQGRYELGEMDDDSMVEWAQIPYSVVSSAEHRALARQMARESIVLLKNDNNVLPLGKKVKIGLIGPNANDSVVQWGNYNGYPASTSTLLSSLEKCYGKKNVTYVPGVDHTSDMLVNSTFSLTRKADGKPGYDAIFFDEIWPDVDEDTPIASYAYTTPLALTTAGATVWAPGVKLGGFAALFTTTFVPDKTEEIAFSLQCQGVVMLKINDEVVFEGGNLKSTAAYKFMAEAGKEYEVKLLFRATEGDCAALNFDFGTQQPLDIDKVIAPLADADVIIFAGGLSPMLEGEEMSVKIEGFKGGDRELIELPSSQRRMLKALAAMGKPMVFVNFSGSAVALTPDDVPAQAIVQAWYPGEAGGDALVDVLTGKYNPSGRLPVTFYASTDDLPDFCDYNMYGRTYRYFEGEPLYAFGHGLSYTTFEYGPATIAKNAQGQDVIRFKVTNTGKRAGDEVAQLYVARQSDLMGPKRQLRGFERISLKPKESKELEFVIDSNVLKWYNEKTKQLEPQAGEYVLYYGPSSTATNAITYDYK